ncbi:VOC family protein, partial [Algoriphagus sp.]|uniref:VOC family protein n=1 Tax=Algoriphagus sp. TaxID=1872435 RepID=UPI0025E77A7D
NAKEAATFYCQVFPDSKVLDSNPFVTIFESSGQKFLCLNGGPEFPITPSISMYTVLDSEELIQKIWDQLIDGGSAMMPLDTYPWSKKYGWVKDKYGVSWQLTVDKPASSDQRFSPCLMFSGNNFGKAEEAIEFYTSIFKNSKSVFAAKYGAEHGVQEGKIMHAQFILNNGLFVAMDSSYDHGFNFNEGISFVIDCKNQKEIDYYWEKLTAEGGSSSQCGWLKDKFGVSWQIVPVILGSLISNPVKGSKAMEALMKMSKIIIAELQSTS